MTDRRVKGRALSRDSGIALGRAHRWGRRAPALALSVLLAVGCGAPQEATTTGEPPGRAVPDEGSGVHVEEGAPLRYRNDPPASGPHYRETAEYNVYTNVVPEGFWVHNLEHGAIVVLYRCPGGVSPCPEVTNRLQELYDKAPLGKYGEVKLVASEYPRLETPLALLAWNRIEELESYDEARMLRFYEAYLDRGPEDAR